MFVFLSQLGHVCRCRPACPCYSWSYRPVRSISDQPMHTSERRCICFSLPPS
jgi:hypothetical protein